MSYEFVIRYFEDVDKYGVVRETGYISVKTFEPILTYLRSDGCVSQTPFYFDTKTEAALMLLLYR